MSETRSNILIPNVVGRLDPVVHAIRAENWVEVQSLVLEEQIRRQEKVNQLVEQAKKEQDKVVLLKAFFDKIFDPQLRERILQEANQ